MRRDTGWRRARNLGVKYDPVPVIPPQTYDFSRLIPVLFEDF
jgi:hypothetical protein